MHTLVGPTIGYNVLRAICSGITLSVLLVGATIFGGSSPATSGGELVGAIFGIMLGPLVLLPFGLLAAWAISKFRNWFMHGGPVGLVFGLVATAYFWVPLIALMMGDPAVLLLKRIAPGVVPVDRPKLWNPHMLILVQDADEETPLDVEPERTYREERPGNERQRNEDSRVASASAATSNLVADQSASDWIETTSNIENDRVRQSLEAANSYLDDATALVHPPTAIDAKKADDIDRLIVRVREQLSEARAVNDTVHEPGVADYIELLDAGAEQYAGIAHALGRRRLAEGARLIERAVERLERLGRKHDSSATSHMSLYLLSVIHLEMGDRGAALSFIRRAIAANPGDADYRKLRDQIEGEIGSSSSVEDPSAGGGARRFAVLATVAIVACGAVFYLWQSSQRPVQVAAPIDPNHFNLLPYTAQEAIVAREGELNIRALPFSRPDISVLRQSILGEVLNVTGLVNQPDGPWYKVRLADGRDGYFKASLAIPQSEYAAASLEMFSGPWENTDAATRDLTRISVRNAEGAAYVHAFGRCTPTDCDWGEAPLSIDLSGISESRTATAFYDHGFSEVRLTLTMGAKDSDAFEYRGLTHFKDASGRQDMESHGVMRRATGAPIAVSSALPQPAPPLASSDSYITNPSWIERPNGRDFERYYPPAALTAGTSARVVLNCIVGSDGRIACTVVSEDPGGWGFGEASLKIARSFRMAPQFEDGRPKDGGRVRIPIVWRLN